MPNKIPEGKLNDIKELLANTALGLLEQGSDFTDAVNTKVEFGYIYLREDNYEAMFKVITDKKTVYFAVQKGQMMRLNDTFNDLMFEGTAKQMKELHGNWK